MFSKKNPQIIKPLVKLFVLEAIDTYDPTRSIHEDDLQNWVKNFLELFSEVFKVEGRWCFELLDSLVKNEEVAKGLCPADGPWDCSSQVGEIEPSPPSQPAESLSFSIYECVQTLEGHKNELGRRCLAAEDGGMFLMGFREIIRRQGRSGSYDARTRTLLRKVCRRLQQARRGSVVGWRQVQEVEQEADCFASLPSLVSTDEDVASLNELQKPCMSPAWQRGAQIVVASAAGGAALTSMGAVQAMTALYAGGLAEFTQFLSGFRVASSLWAVAGATTSGIRASRRVAGVKEFRFVPLFVPRRSNNNHEVPCSKGLPTFILIPGWLSNKEAPAKVWGGDWEHEPELSRSTAPQMSGGNNQMDQLTLTIPRYCFKHDSHSKKFTAYQICVSSPFAMWEVERRHAEFEALRSALSRKIKGVPSFPLVHSWRYKSNVDRRLVEKRRQKLQEFLQKLCVRKDVCQSQEFQEFLEIQDNIEAMEQEPDRDAAHDLSEVFNSPSNGLNFASEQDPPGICFSLRSASKVPDDLERKEEPDSDNDTVLSIDDAMIINDNYFSTPEQSQSTSPVHSELGPGTEALSWSMMVNSTCQVVKNGRRHDIGWWRAAVSSAEEHILVWEQQLLVTLKKQIENILNETVKSMVKEEFFNQLIKFVAIPEAAIPLQLLGALKGLDNPWTLCMKRAKIAGTMLAEVLIRNTKGGAQKRPVTLVGFSFGAMLIYYCLRRLAKQGAQGKGLVENAVILGAPVSTRKERWATAASVISGRIINGYSKRDWMLATVFRMKNQKLTIAGCSPVKLDSVENIDLSDIIGYEHFMYESRLKEIIFLLHLEDEHENFSAL